MKYLLTVFTLFIFLSYSCRPTDNFDTSPEIKLEFSLDTLRFDTVFTELGSATRILKVYNREKKDIKISKISIKNDPGSFFRINVDGISGNIATDIEIAGKDSLYIFAEVTIDPDAPLSVSPFVIEDYLVFEINGNTQEVLMEAWGQNANYHPDRFSIGETNGVGCSGGALTGFFDDPKPHVFYGTFIFEECDVTIPAGTRIHVHGGIASEFDQSNMRFFFNDGRIIFLNSNLDVQGTVDNPVIISGDRLEEPFSEISGQWWGIYLLNTPTTTSPNPVQTSHNIQFMEIKNSILGVVADSTNLTLESSKVYNTSNAGLIAIRSNVDATNTLFYNNGSNAVRILFGGNYNFDYCTLASYGVDAPALSMSNATCLVTNDIGQCVVCDDFPLTATFRNSIIFGSKKDEIDLTNSDDCNLNVSSPVNYTFQDCIVRVDELTEQEGFEDFFTFCDPCQNGDSNDALFFDPNEDDYHLDTLSIAEMKAEPISGVEFDLDGFDRASGGDKPDVGCYEYQY